MNLYYFEFSFMGKFFKLKYIYIISVMALVMLIGCLKLTKDFPIKKNFLLEAYNPKISKVNFKDANIKIRKVIVSNKFEGKGFVYRKTDSNFESDFYNEFLVSPQSNLMEEIQKYLDRKEIFGAVVSMSSRMEATHYIEAEIFSLYGDYRNSKKPFAVIEGNFRYFDDRQGNYKQVFRKDYKKAISIQNDSPESLISGWNQGLSEILEELSYDLSRF